MSVSQIKQAATTHNALNVVPFVSVDHMMAIVGKIGVKSMLKGIADYLEQDFARWNSFDKTPRVAAHSKDGVIELMPCANDQLYSFKYVNGHPKNTKEGLQTVTAFGVLADVDSGYPILLSEMTILTALRTAATSALVAKYLAPKDSQCMAIIGNGAQSEFQALAFEAILGIKKLRLYDIDRSASERCARNLAAYGFDISLCDSTVDAVDGAQIITTVTADKLCATILSDNMVGEGVHINAVGGDCPGKTELAKEILLRSEIFVEYPPQTRIEGEIQQLPEDSPVHEFWQVVDGSHHGRLNQQQITLFDSVGFATEDFSALRYVYEQLAQPGMENMSQTLDMIADPDEPRDLFGMLIRSGYMA